MKKPLLTARATVTSIPLALLLVSVGACSKSPENVASNSAQIVENNDVVADAVVDEAIAPGNRATPAVPTDEWAGKWIGPEGLFLSIEPEAGKTGRYKIVNRDTLDREESYSGVADGATIRFVRDGKDLTIQYGSGADTGFKWLADKKECLIVIKGEEGYCKG